MSQTRPVVPIELRSRCFAGLIPLILFALAQSALSTTAWSQCRYRPPSPRLPIGLKLTIRAEKAVAEASKPVIIQVELLNGSNTPITMRDNWFPARDYELHVHDASGKEAPFTKYGHQVRTGPVGGSGNDVTLAPGEKYTTQQDLSAMYEISVSGNYTVEACRELYDWGNIYSNKIVVPFVPPPADAK